MKWASKIILCVLLVNVSSMADEYWVATDGNNNNPGTKSQPFATIQYAIHQTVSGDEVICKAGTYTGEGNRDIDFGGVDGYVGGVNIYVHSENEAGGCTIICNEPVTFNPDGTVEEGTIPDYKYRAFIFDNGETPYDPDTETGAKLEGFTIINGYHTKGGAILCQKDGSTPSNPTIENCIFKNNTALIDGNDEGDAMGGAICIEYCWPTIENCNFGDTDPQSEAGNIAYAYNTTSKKALGGAIYAIGADSMNIINCNFYYNKVYGDTYYPGGGGIYFAEGISAKIENCHFEYNVAGFDYNPNSSRQPKGGGIYFYCAGDYEDHNKIIVNNCDFENNISYYSGGAIEISNSYVNFNYDEAGHEVDSSCTFTTNKAFDNSSNFPGDYYGYGGAINIVVNELFHSFTKLNNCDFDENSADNQGGGISVSGAGYANLQCNNCKLEKNKAGGSSDSWGGGGISCSGDEISLEIKECDFIGNYLEQTSAVWGGGGAVSSTYCTLRFEKCIFHNNNAQGSRGGGIFTNCSSGLIYQCEFKENTAEKGGAIYENQPANKHTINCSFFGNSSTMQGGGLFVSGVKNDLLAVHTKYINCIFVENESGYGYQGGAIYMDPIGIQYVPDTGSYDSRIINCTFTHNITEVTEGGYDIYLIGDDIPNRPLYYIYNNIIWNDKLKLVGDPLIFNEFDVQYNNISNLSELSLYTGLGNINDDPLYVEDPTSGNYGNLRLEVGSDCIDTGNTEFIPVDSWNLDDDDTTTFIPYDMDRLSREYDGNGDGSAVVDMGAYEWHPECWYYDCFPCGDSNGDCQINYADLIILKQHWPDEPDDPYYPCVDFSRDGKIDYDDLQILRQYFGTDCDICCDCECVPE